MEAADSTDPTQFRSALRYVANPPGHTILPGQWAEALAALDAGENIDYWGAANRADFDRYGDVGTAYGVWLVDGAGVIRTVAVLDEPIFWTPAPEDPLPPHVAISSPTEGACRSGVSSIRGTANASLGIAAIQVHVDGGEWQKATGSVTWTFDLNTTALSDGPHRNAARTFDGTHYTSEATIDVTVDNSPPSIMIRSPLAGAYVAASLAIANWSATDPVSGVERIEVQLDTSSPLVLPGTATNQSFANLAGGAHSLTVRAIDRAGNVGERSVAFIADASGPTTAFSIDGTQGDAFWFTSDVRITLAFVDSGSGVETTFIRVDQNPWQAYTTPLVVSADGVYNVSFYARDRVGNIGGSTWVRIPIDRTPPDLTVDPLPALVTHSGVTVTWAGSDGTSGIRGYEISVDGGPFGSVGTASAKQLILADGDHIIRIRASDNAGHNVTASIAVRVESPDRARHRGESRLGARNVRPAPLQGFPCGPHEPRQEKGNRGGSRIGSRWRRCAVSSAGHHGSREHLRRCEGPPSSHSPPRPPRKQCGDRFLGSRSTRLGSHDRDELLRIAGCDGCPPSVHPRRRPRGHGVERTRRAVHPRSGSPPAVRGSVAHSARARLPRVLIPCVP